MSASRPPWDRVRRDLRCPICSRHDWCLVSLDGSAVICARTAEGAVRRIGESGWLHRIGPDEWSPSGPRRIVVSLRSREADARQSELADLDVRFRAAVDPARLVRLVSSLGLSVESLRRLRIGWCESSKAWSLPMFGHRDQIVGIRLRTGGGRKFAIKGGHDGLFSPQGLDASGRLLICEGPTDTAAMLDLGFEAIGRPSARGATSVVLALVRARRPAEVVVAGDNDPNGVGLEGALALVRRVVILARRVKLLAPPPEVKDLRAWLLAGATHSDVEAAIEASDTHRISIRTPAHAGEGRDGD